MKNFFEKNKTLWQVLIVNAAALLLMILLFYPRFQNEADIVMQTLIYGVGQGGVNISHILFSNILLGKLLQAFVYVFPSVAWYVIFHYIAVFGGLLCISYVIVKRNPSKTGWIFMFVVVAFISYEGYVFPGYIKTASILCTAAFFALTYCIEKKHISVKNLAQILILAGCSSLFSITTFGITFVICCLLMVVNLSTKHLKKNDIEKIAAVVVGMLVAAAALFLLDVSSYVGSNNWKDMQAMRWDYEKIFSYGAAAYDEDTVDAINVSFGYDQSDEDSEPVIETYAEYFWLTWGVFLNNNEQTPELIHKVAWLTQKISGKTLMKFFRTVPISLFNVGIFYLLIILLAMKCLLQKDGRCRTAVAALLMLFVGMYVGYLFNALSYNRFHFVILLPICSFVMLSMKNITSTDNRTVVVYLVVLSVILYSRFASTMVTSVNENDMAKAYEDMQDQEVCFIDFDEYAKKFSVFKPYTQDLASASNVYMVNGIYSYIYFFGYNAMPAVLENIEQGQWIDNSKSIYIMDVINFAE
jgi:hypothetical protein